jgi:hypothetical protein
MINFSLKRKLTLAFLLFMLIMLSLAIVPSKPGSRLLRGVYVPPQTSIPDSPIGYVPQEYRKDSK